MRDCVGLTGSYVYVLVDPRDGTVFYVGKGTGRRFAAHLAEYRSSRILNAFKCARIGEIVGDGMLPKAICLRDGLTHAQAYALESAVIARIGLHRLTNCQGGVQTEAMRGLVMARAVMAEHFSWDRWPEIRRWSYQKQKQWCAIRDDMLETVAMCERLVARDALNLIKA